MYDFVCPYSSALKYALNWDKSRALANEKGFLFSHFVGALMEGIKVIQEIEISEY